MPLSGACAERDANEQELYTRLGEVVMTGEHWERRRAKATAAFEALKNIQDPQDAVRQPLAEERGRLRALTRSGARGALHAHATRTVRSHGQRHVHCHCDHTHRTVRSQVKPSDSISNVKPQSIISDMSAPLQLGARAARPNRNVCQGIVE